MVADGIDDVGFRDPGQADHPVFGVGAFQGQVHEAEPLQRKGLGNDIVFDAVHFQLVGPFKKYSAGKFNCRSSDEIFKAADIQHRYQAVPSTARLKKRKYGDRYQASSRKTSDSSTSGKIFRMAKLIAGRSRSSLLVVIFQLF
jgi:hypothetical protein